MPEVASDEEKKIRRERERCVLTGRVTGPVDCVYYCRSDIGPPTAAGAYPEVPGGRAFDVESCCPKSAVKKGMFYRRD